MTEPLRVLLVEDSATDAKLVLRELRRAGRKIEFERVEDAAAMRAALEEKTWDVVISDWSMPKFSAPAALGVLKEKALDLPFIIVSGTVGEESAVEAMRAGAHDYVLKDKLARLTPALERELRECKERKARRSAEEALRQSEARFRRLAESGIIGILTTDVNGSILDANEAYAKMIGYSRAELLRGDVRWVELTPPELRQWNDRALEQLRVTGVASPWETETFRKDGRRVPILVGVAALESSKCIAFTADLTARKLAESGRMRAEEALHRSEEQLRHAQKMEAVGRLAGGVAHDFNNLLSVILSYSAMMLDELKPGEPMRDDVQQIRDAGKRAESLTRQLLMFSRQQVVEPRVVDLNEMLAGMEKMLRRLVGEDVEFVFTPGASLGKVRVDPGSIEQVVMNLVVNARDAMPIGGKLTIETSNATLDERYAREHLGVTKGPHVLLAVSDTGSGMDKATQARIFEPFFTTKEVGKGTGLGLSTVFGIIQQSGGSVWVYSEVGRGTSFKVYLPLVEGATAESRPPIASSTLRGSETILLVEDEEAVRVVARGILKRQGYRVIEARNGGEALLLCEKHPGVIHLLLSDVVMPQMGGPELARRLAKGRPAMKILCMSGYTDDAVVRHGALQAGIAFIQKPITPDTLTRKVREVLDAKRPA